MFGLRHKKTTNEGTIRILPKLQRQECFEKNIIYGNEKLMFFDVAAENWDYKRYLR